MNLPDLHALQTGDADAWDEAFSWLWPVVFAVAQLKLQPYFPNEVEDVAIESLEQLVEKVCDVKSPEKLKALAATIAHHRAVSLLRERFTKKRGEGRTESLDAPNERRRQPFGTIIKRFSSGGLGAEGIDAKAWQVARGTQTTTG